MDARSIRNAKGRGRYAETQVVEFLRANGWPYAERRRQAGSKDKGDVVFPLVIEVKNQRAHDLAGWIDELEVEKDNADVEHGIVCFPRKRMATAEWYALTTLADWCELAKAAGW